MIKYVGKCLVIEEKGEKILVVGDLHMGYSSSMKIGGIDIDSELYTSSLNELKYIIEGEKNINKIIFLGDLKNNFGEITKEERFGLVNLFNDIAKIDKKIEIILIKGNHDNFLVKIIKIDKIKLFDYYVIGNMCFLHGDREFEIMNDKKIECWIMGHLHPAVRLNSGAKSEKYKCFLIGKYKNKKVIILPSFLEYGVGSEYEGMINQSIWKFDILNFDVLIIGENKEIFKFGRLKDIESY